MLEHEPGSGVLSTLLSARHLRCTGAKESCIAMTDQSRSAQLLARRQDRHRKYEPSLRARQESPSAANIVSKRRYQALPQIYMSQSTWRHPAGLKKIRLSVIGQGLTGIPT